MRVVSVRTCSKSITLHAKKLECVLNRTVSLLCPAAEIHHGTYFEFTKQNKTKQTQVFSRLRKNGGHGSIEENEENNNMWFVFWDSWFCTDSDAGPAFTTCPSDLRGMG